MLVTMLSSTKERQQALDDMKQMLRTNNRLAIILKLVVLLVLSVNLVIKSPTFFTTMEWLDASEQYKYKHLEILSTMSLDGLFAKALNTSIAPCMTLNRLVLSFCANFNTAVFQTKTTQTTN